MKKRLTLLIILAFLLTFSSLLGAAPKWEFAKRSGGVTVYTRPIKGSDMDEFQGVTVVNAPMEVVLQVMQDVSAYPQWQQDCIKARVVSRKSKYMFTVYFVNNAPWPVSDRDMVVRSKTTINLKKGLVVSSMRALKSSSVPKNSDYVRITDLKGRYVFEYISRNKTRVTYIIKANPGGSVPTSLANMTSKAIPLGTLKGLKRMVKKKKYIDGAQGSEEQQIIEKAVKEGSLK
ncbi:MAG: START domain-containing protein [bacterium]|nr:START domain-containing protein [bacterium]